MANPVYCSLYKEFFGAYMAHGSCALDGNGNFTGGSFSIYGPGANIKRQAVHLGLYKVTEEGLVEGVPAVGEEAMQIVRLANNDIIEVAGHYTETPIIVGGKTVYQGGLGEQRQITGMTVNGNRVFPTQS